MACHLLEVVYPGIVLIAKIGTTKSYLREAMPDTLEYLVFGRDAMIQKYGHLFYDTSLYVPEGICGTVKEAFNESVGQFKRAVVRLDTGIKQVD